MPQRAGHRVLTLTSGQFQNPHVHPVGDRLGMGGAKHIVGDAESAGREHLFAILVVGECAGFANQRIDDVAIVDQHLLFADQPRHGLNRVPLMRHADLFGADANIDRLTNQSAGNGIRVGPHLDRTASADPNAAEHVVGVETCLGQWPQRGLFFHETGAATGVGPTDQLFHELHVLGPAGEITAAAQQQRLVHAILQMPVGRFDIAVLIGTPRIGPLRLTAVMVHQRGVPLGKCPAARVIPHGRTERIRAMPLRDAAEFPERLLNAFAEGFERFGKAQRDRFDIAPGQHAVKQRVVKSFTGDPHAQVVAHREVAGGQPARMVNLPEEHRLARSVKTPPPGHAALERAAIRIRKAARIRLLQPAKQGDRLQGRFAFQLPLNLVPDILKRIASGPVRARRFPLRRQSLVVAILACGLFTHFRHPCRSGQRPAQTEQSPQFPDLTILDHRNLPLHQELR